MVFGEIKGGKINMSNYFEPRIQDTLRAQIYDIAYPIARNISCAAKQMYSYLGRKVTQFPAYVVTRISVIFRDTMAMLSSMIEQVLQEIKQADVQAPPASKKEPQEPQASQEPQAPLELLPPLFSNYSYRPRAVKKVLTKDQVLTEPFIRIDPEKLDALALLAKDKSSIETTAFGSGIENGKNSCYIAATLQMLRVSRIFRGYLDSSMLRDNELATRMKKIFASIEGSEHAPPKPLSAHEINDFRQFLIAKRWDAEGEYTQEDAWLLCGFLIDKLRFSTFRIEPDIVLLHEKDKDRDFPKAPESQVNSLTGLLKKDQTETELSKIAFENVVEEEGGIETLHKIKLKSDSIPLLLPIVTRRYSSQNAPKNITKILPSDYIDAPLEGLENSVARYRLTSIVSHDGTTPKFGHYICYAPAMWKTQKVYFEFSDSSTMLHFSDKEIITGLQKNSYVYMYEFVRVIKQS
jgi:hypothetical protein